MIIDDMPHIEEYSCKHCGWVTASRPLFQDHVNRHLHQHHEELVDEVEWKRQQMARIPGEPGICLD